MERRFRVRLEELRGDAEVNPGVLRGVFLYFCNRSQCPVASWPVSS